LAEAIVREQMMEEKEAEKEMKYVLSNKTGIWWRIMKPAMGGRRARRRHIFVIFIVTMVMRIFDVWDLKLHVSLEMGRNDLFSELILYSHINLAVLHLRMSKDLMIRIRGKSFSSHTSFTSSPLKHRAQAYRWVGGKWFMTSERRNKFASQHRIVRDGKKSVIFRLVELFSS
jgi:hypothetical protein